MHILLAGDGFLLPEILQTAIGELGLDAQTTQIRNDWPVTPMVDIGGVREANGDFSRPPRPPKPNASVGGGSVPPAPSGPAPAPTITPAQEH